MILIIYANLLKDPNPLNKIFGIEIFEWIINYINIDNFTQILILYNNELYKMKIKNLILNRYPINNFLFAYIYNNDIFSAILNKICEDTNESLLYIDTNKFYIEDLYKLCNNNTIFYTDMIENRYGAFSFTSFLEFKKYSIKLCNLYKILSINYQLLNINQLVNLMIDDGISFNYQILNIDNIINLETHFHLRLFCNNYPKVNAYNNKNMILNKRICYELENTLISKCNLEYIPIQHNIDYLNYLKKIGNTIIIHTCYQQQDQDILKILLEFKICYDEIYYNKPCADFYIDSNNILLDNIEKQLGFYNNRIDARDFNQVIYKDIKTYKKISDDLSGEIYYYLNIPNDIKDIFPTMLSYDKNMKSYEMENINGIPISKLYLNEELSIKQFDNIIGTINRIHKCASYNKDIKINIYGNYSNKLKERYEKYNYEIYEGSDSLYKFLIDKLTIYEEQNLGYQAIIHGDPVLTNILINKFGKIKLIDMRGSIDKTLTIYGDKLYDWAKIYQSLIGYDEILDNKIISKEYKKMFLEYFEKRFLDFFTTDDLYYLKIITASLLLSLIPLHKNDKCNLYYKLIYKIDIIQ